VVPATIAIISGKICVGLDNGQLEHIASDKNIYKVALRDLSHNVSNGFSGATTVSATMRVAHKAGIRVFSTGGIGGVHRDWSSSADVSQDLHELGRTPLVVVSSGAKAILDLPKTVEFLESLSVPVFGYKTNDFPAFYSCESGIKIERRVESPKGVAEQFETHLLLGLSSAILLANPVPREEEIERGIVSVYIEKALVEAKKSGVCGKELTPFLLGEIYRLSGGLSLKTNIALALNNITSLFWQTKLLCKKKLMHYYNRILKRE
jgi:pseudouridine-5'-phosphate glycosidase